MILKAIDRIRPIGDLLKKKIDVLENERDKSFEEAALAACELFVTELNAFKLLNTEGRYAYSIEELAIYKIKDDSELVLLKQFSGEAEGTARRLDGNKVEMGTGFTDKNVGHLGFDQTRLEIWEYKDGKFIKTSEKSIPHILWSKEWEKYYF